MVLIIDAEITLEQIDLKHSEGVFELASANREHIGEWMPWIIHMQSVEFIQNFSIGSNQRNKDGNEFAFVILENGKIVGRIGVYKIDNQNKTGEIGYWIGEKVQGKGIVTRSCEGLIDFCFDRLNLNRVEIRCAVENVKSQRIPERLHFEQEGILRQAEWLHNRFSDLRLYSMLRQDWRNR